MSSEVITDGIVGEGAELHLQLPGFEGPFDLLLHLIEEHELDILDIPIAFVTERYLQYLALMQELNIDVASDYLVMAATLAHLKSRLLLPTPPADDDAEEEGEDPRAELIRRLLEYQKYKHAAEELASRSVLGRDTFVRGALPETVEGPAPLAPVGVFKLLEAFQRILERAKTVVDHQIEFERLSITDRINQLVDRLRQFGSLSFDALFDGQRTRAELIVTFLALLEMTRLRLTNVHQDHALAPIMVQLAVNENGVQAIDTAAADYLGDRSSYGQKGVIETPDAEPEPSDRDTGLDASSREDEGEQGKHNGRVQAPETVEQSGGVANQTAKEPEAIEQLGVNDLVEAHETVEQSGGVANQTAEEPETLQQAVAAGDELARKQSGIENGSE